MSLSFRAGCWRRDSGSYIVPVWLPAGSVSALIALIACPAVRSGLAPAENRLGTVRRVVSRQRDAGGIKITPGGGMAHLMGGHAIGGRGHDAVDDGSSPPQFGRSASVARAVPYPEGLLF